MNQFYVYHCAYPNGRKYIGSKTVAPEQSPDYFGSNPVLKEDLKSMNKEHIVKEILFETDDILELEDLELTAIKQHNAVEDDSYYNESHRTQIAFYGKTHSEEAKLKNKESHMGEKNPMYGKKMSKESRQKMTEVKTGVIQTRETVLRKAITRLENGLTKPVAPKKNGNQYEVQITINKKNTYFGSYPTHAQAEAVSLEVRKKRIAELKAELQMLQGEKH